MPTMPGPHFRGQCAKALAFHAGVFGRTGPSWIILTMPAEGAAPQGH